MTRAWVPTLTGVTLGTGGSAVGTYRFDGTSVIAKLVIILGTGGTMGTNPSFSLPVEACAPDMPSQVHAQIGSALINGSVYPVFAAADTTLTRRLWALDDIHPGFRLIGASWPAVWGSGSKVVIEFTFYPANPIMPRTFGAIGDSITAWSAAQGWNTQTTSWTNFVPTAGLCFAGGWAQGGAATSWMLSNARPLLADTLVLMGGSNDIYGNVPIATTLANIEAIVAAAGTPHTLILAIPPYDARVADATTLNAALVALAASHSWSFVDPWAAFRASSGAWVVGAAVDGVHPTPATQQAAGLIIRTTLLGD